MRKERVQRGTLITNIILIYVLISVLICLCIFLDTCNAWPVQLCKLDTKDILMCMSVCTHTDSLTLFMNINLQTLTVNKYDTRRLSHQIYYINTAERCHCLLQDSSSV